MTSFLAFRAFLRGSLLFMLVGHLYAKEDPTAPAGLLTNGNVNPDAIDAGTARFTWVMYDPERGARQSKYRILVASSRALLDSQRGDLWDSGEVASAASAMVDYAGGVMKPANRYWWKVMLWDEDGKPSPWSAPATFVVGLAKPDWTAKFIWDGTQNNNNFAYFRKAFRLEKPVSSALVFVSAHNVYRLHLNGVALGDGPARCDPEKYGQYLGYDVTAALAQGDNVFAAEAYWQNTFQDSGVNAKPAFILEARITFSDGTATTIVTDASWKALADTPYLEDAPKYYGGAGGANNRPSLRYDARRELPGWRQAGFEDSAWRPASVVDRASYNLYAQLVAPPRVMEELKPLSVVKEGEDWLVDFGKCLCGWPRLTLRDRAPGTVVTIEQIEQDKADPKKAYPLDTHICKGGTEVSDTYLGRYASFRMLRIRGYTGALQAADITAQYNYGLLDPVGRFNSSHAALNGIFECSRRTAVQCVQFGTVLTDADREQSPWTADIYNIALGLPYYDRSSMVMYKAVRDYAAQQEDNGNMGACSPAMTRADGFFNIPEWTLYYPMILWEQYLATGDKAMLRETWSNLERMLAYMDGFKKPDTALIDPPGNRITDYHGGSTLTKGQAIGANCQFHLGNRIAAAVATELGHTEKARTYSTRAEELRDAINRHLWDGKAYLSTVGDPQVTRVGSSWAVLSGVVPPERLARVRDFLTGQSDGVGLNGGMALLCGLFEAGSARRALHTLLEAFVNWDKGTRVTGEGMYAGTGNNHAWNSYCSWILPRYLAGVRPTSGGYATWDLRPVSPDRNLLNAVEALVPSPKGAISTKWSQTSSSFTLEVTVPANSTARVFLPCAGLTSLLVTEGAAVLWKDGRWTGDVPGVRLLSEPAEHLILQVGSGSYVFTVKGAGPVGTSNAQQSTLK